MFMSKIIISEGQLKGLLNLLNENKSKIRHDFLNTLKNDIIDSDSIKSFAVKARDSYGKEELEILNSFTDFIAKPQNNHNRKNREILYHGSPDEIEKFKHTKGRRGGFLGAIKEVDNLGVFLTDDKRLANFYGNNRANYNQNFKIYTLFVDLGRILHYDQLPKNLIKIANNELKVYYGKRIKISKKYFWWLLDNPNFINEVRKNYDSILYYEEYETIKLSGSSGKGYFILDPDRIEIYKPLTFDELKKNIDFYISTFSYGL
jgi:hypothetical protein